MMMDEAQMLARLSRAGKPGLLLGISSLNLVQRLLNSAL
jgi:hypothetical protein